MEPTLAHYRLLGPLGAGGMGEVFRAEDTRLGREVALKRLATGSAGDPAARSRLIREARLAATLQHPNICTIFEVGEADGEIYIAMELVRGRPLNSMLPAGGLPAESTLRYGAQIADALAHAHEHGVIHRDLKCANVVIDDQGRARVLDFGLAVRSFTGADDATRSMEAPLTETGTVVGTPGYLAPEVLRGKPADPRSDLWSLGVMLYEMTSGRRPFPGGTAIEVNAAILSAEPTPLPASVLPGLRAAILRCLQKEPAHRYRNAGEVRAALEALASDRTAPVSPAPSRRRGMKVVIAILVLAAIVGIAAFAVWRPSGPHELIQRQIASRSDNLTLISGSLSPDGRSLAVAGTERLEVRDLATGDSRAIDLPAGFSFVTPLGPVAGTSWYPDGRQILVSGSMPDGGLSLWVIPVFGGRPRQLRDDGAGGVVSPDGAHIAFMKFGGKGPDIWCANAEGADPRLVVSSDSTGFISTPPSWSPVGTRLAYVRTPVGADVSPTRIETVDLDGRRQIVFRDSPTQRIHNYGTVAWLPDQRMVFGLSEPPPSQGDLNLWWLRVNVRSGAASGSPHRITRWTSASLLEPTASADGKRLVVANLSYQSDVFVARVASRDSMLQDASRLTVDARFDVQPEWSSDGGSILFASDRNGGQDIFRQSPGSPDAEPVVTGPGEQMQPRVSPDGHWLLYLEAQASSGPGDVNRPGGPGSTERLRRMPIAGGAAETVCEVAAGSSFRCARSPSSRCVMVEPTGGKSVAEAFDPLRGKIGEIGTLELSALSAWDLSPDGSAIAYTDRGDTTTQIHVWSVADGARRAIRTSLPFGIAALAWDGAGTGWYAVGVMNQRGQGVRWQIFRIAPDGRTWPVLPPQIWMYGFSLSRDGRRIAFTSNTGQASAWLLENF